MKFFLFITASLLLCLASSVIGQESNEQIITTLIADTPVTSTVVADTPVTSTVVADSPETTTTEKDITTIVSTGMSNPSTTGAEVSTTKETRPTTVITTSGEISTKGSTDKYTGGYTGYTGKPTEKPGDACKGEGGQCGDNQECVGNDDDGWVCTCKPDFYEPEDKKECVSGSRMLISSGLFIALAYLTLQLKSMTSL